MGRRFRLALGLESLLAAVLGFLVRDGREVVEDVLVGIHQVRL